MTVDYEESGIDEGSNSRLHELARFFKLDIHHSLRLLLHYNSLLRGLFLFQSTIERLLLRWFNFTVDFLDQCHIACQFEQSLIEAVFGFYVRFPRFAVNVDLVNLRCILVLVSSQFCKVVNISVPDSLFQTQIIKSISSVGGTH